jgi:acyl-CoA synthetase (AMP-forming)/AMP-acid ligase II
MAAMSEPALRALHDRFMASLESQPRRDAARTVPGGAAFDVDGFERRVMGFDRRLLRLSRPGDGDAAPLQPDAAQLVLLSARNLPAWLVAAAGLWKRGFVPLLADADLGRSEIAGLVESFRPAFCLLDRRVEPAGGKVDDFGDAIPGLRAWRPPRRLRAAAVPGAAVVRLTSGTTGKPRGCVVTADQLLADARQIAATMGIAPRDSIVAAIPLSHAYGFVYILMSLVLQGTRPILLEQPIPAALLEAISGPGPIVLPGTPYLFELILKAAGKRRFKGLRLCLSAGAPLPADLGAAFTKAIGLPIRTFYGASECGGIAYDRSSAGGVPDGCVGTPLDGVTIDTVPVPGGDPGIGRVRVASAAVATGYLDHETIHPFEGPPGRFLTQDLGRLDDRGRLWITGRADRTINVDGRKVNPAEVENVLRGIPKVRQAIVLPIADRRRGQTICACLVAGRGLTREAVLAACAARLAPFKMPRRIEFLDALPLTGRGKTDHAALAARIAGPPLARPPAKARPRPAV